MPAKTMAGPGQIQKPTTEGRSPLWVPGAQAREWPYAAIQNTIAESGAECQDSKQHPDTGCRLSCCAAACTFSSMQEEYLWSPVQIHSSFRSSEHFISGYSDPTRNELLHGEFTFFLSDFLLCCLMVEGGRTREQREGERTHIHPFAKGPSSPQLWTCSLGNPYVKD